MHEIYVLNSNFNQQELIDSYETLLWTERYSAEGEVVLTVSDTPWNRATLKEGAFLSIPESREVMIIESRSSEKGVLKIVGISLAGFLRNRIMRFTWRTDYNYWRTRKAAGDLCGFVIKNMCMAGPPGKTETGANDFFLMQDGFVVTEGVAELFPKLRLGPLGAGPNIFRALKFGNVYDVIKEICDSADQGFSLYPTNITETNHELIFTTYEGRNLTGSQTINPVVRFEPALDSLTNVQELRSISGYKNVAYAWAPNIVSSTIYIVGVAYADANASASREFARRTLYVAADDINDYDISTTASVDELREILTQRAIDGLVNNNYVRMVDGELVPQNGFEYLVDYNLGDILELGASSGESSAARVTEYIRSRDASGYAEYPTLSVIS